MTMTVFNVCHVTMTHFTVTLTNSKVYNVIITDFNVCHVPVNDFEVCHVTRLHTSLKLDVYHTYKLPDHYKACYIIIWLLGYTYHVCI